MSALYHATVAASLISFGVWLLVHANEVEQGHNFSPRSANTISRAMSSRTLVRAQSCNCASVSFDFVMFRPFVAASNANRVACAADLPVMGGAARRAQHQTDVFSTAMEVAFTMDHSFAPTEWKPLASAGKHSQAELLDAPSSPTLLDDFVLVRASFNGALNESVRRSGKEDQAIADEIHISPGYMSRFMRGVGQQWAKRLVAFMHATNSRAPLQWIAHQVGCEVVLRAPKDAEIRRLEAELARAKGYAA